MVSVVAASLYHAIAHRFTADPMSAYINGFASEFVFQTVEVLSSLAFEEAYPLAALDAVTAVGVV